MGGAGVVIKQGKLQRGPLGLPGEPGAGCSLGRSYEDADAMSGLMGPGASLF